MNKLLEVFCEENWLQVADHIGTIIFGFISVLLAIMIIRLERRDKTKTIAINELQAQTKKLEDLYLYQIQPRFVVKLYSSNQLKFTNIGWDCYDLDIAIIEKESNNLSNSFNWDKNISSNEEKIEMTAIAWMENVYKFTFNDVVGNKFEQILYPSKMKFSNLKKISD